MAVTVCTGGCKWPPRPRALWKAGQIWHRVSRPGFGFVGAVGPQGLGSLGWRRRGGRNLSAAFAVLVCQHGCRVGAQSRRGGGALPESAAERARVERGRAAEHSGHPAPQTSEQKKRADFGRFLDSPALSREPVAALWGNSSAWRPISYARSTALQSPTAFLECGEGSAAGGEDER